jgi:type IV pilus assembly protein PilX
MTRHSQHVFRRGQRGAVLFITLVLLIILTIIGVAAARLQTGEAVMARNDHNHQLAMQAAEAALRDAETNINIGTWNVSQFAQEDAGLYTLQMEVQGATQGSIVDNFDWNAEYPNPNPAAMTYTGPAFVGPPTAPMVTQVIIESLPPQATAVSPLCTASYGSQQQCSVYRITAHAVGGDSTASATLQSVVH